MSFKQTPNFYAKIKIFFKAKLACKDLKNDNVWVQNEVFKAAIRIRMLVEIPSPFRNLLDNGVSHPRIPLSKLGKPVTKLARQCKWSEKSTKTWETKYSS